MVNISGWTKNRNNFRNFCTASSLKTLLPTIDVKGSARIHSRVSLMNHWRCSLLHRRLFKGRSLSEDIHEQANLAMRERANPGVDLLSCRIVPLLIPAVAANHCSSATTTGPGSSSNGGVVLCFTFLRNEIETALEMKSARD